MSPKELMIDHWYFMWFGWCAAVGAWVVLWVWSGRQWWVRRKLNEQINALLLALLHQSGARIPTKPTSMEVCREAHEALAQACDERAYDRDVEVTITGSGGTEPLIDGNRVWHI